jgi:phenylpyruvate tautomerase PptA (4-oxalocrotonate tautomerase family)
VLARVVSHAAGMAQFKIYGRSEALRASHRAISDAIHAAAVRTLALPADKRFHRFIALEEWQSVAPADRTERYLIIEVLMFSGRSSATKKSLLRALMDDLARALALHPNDIEITIIESPRENWAIRGQHGDELSLNYKVDL